MVIDYRNPDNMTKDELLTWAKGNFAIWEASGGGKSDHSTSWYILLLWAERE